MIRTASMRALSRSYAPCPLLLGALVALVLTGCTSTRPSATPSEADASPTADETVQQLRAETERWEGTPYRLGGTSQQGIDCSAFVQILYRDVLDVPLPRTTHRQADAGRAVPAEDVQPGDLVFFHLAHKQRHVGVYLGDDEFAHASTSRGVTVSRLDESYWQNAYWMTRRLLPHSLDTVPSTHADTEASTAQRAGW